MSRLFLRASLLTSISSLFVAAVAFGQAPAPAAAPAAPVVPAGAPAPTPVAVNGPIVAIALPPIPPNSLAGRPRVNMTVAQAVSIALEKNFDVQSQKYSLQNSEESLYSSRSRYFPALTLSGNGPTFTETKSTSSFTGQPSYSRVTGWSTSAVATQNLPTGGTATVSLTPFNRSGDPSTYGTGLTFTFNHPILRGFGRTITQVSLRNSELNLLSAKNNYRARIMDTIQSVENAYSNLINSRDNLEIRQKQEAISQKQYDDSNVRRGAGMQTELQLNQAKQTLLTNVNSRIQAEQTVKNSEDSLRNLLGPSDFNVEIVPTTLTDVNIPVPSVDAAYALTIENSTDYANRLISIRQSELSLAVTKDNLKPSLGLQTSIGSSGRDPILSDSWTSSAHRDNYSWSVGLNFSISIGQYAEKSAYRSGLTNLASAKLGLAQLEQSIKTSVINAVRSIDTNQRSLVVSQVSAQLAEQNYDANAQQYNVGQLTQLALLTSQQSLDSAEVSLAQSKAQLRTSIIALERLEGTTLDRYGIQLPKQDLPPQEPKKSFLDDVLGR